MAVGLQDWAGPEKTFNYKYVFLCEYIYIEYIGLININFNELLSYQNKQCKDNIYIRAYHALRFLMMCAKF